MPTNFETILDEASCLAEAALKHTKTVRADRLNLDIRSGYNLMVGEDFIAVSKDGDRNLQYYGEFEYIDKEYRLEFGDYVFYSSADDRVEDALACYHQEPPGAPDPEGD